MREELGKLSRQVGEGGEQGNRKGGWDFDSERRKTAGVTAGAKPRGEGQEAESRRTWGKGDGDTWEGGSGKAGWHSPRARPGGHCSLHSFPLSSLQGTVL